MEDSAPFAGWDDGPETLQESRRGELGSEICRDGKEWVGGEKEKRESCPWWELGFREEAEEEDVELEHKQLH